MRVSDHSFAIARVAMVMPFHIPTLTFGSHEKQRLLVFLPYIDVTYQPLSPPASSKGCVCSSPTPQARFSPFGFSCWCVFFTDEASKQVSERLVMLWTVLGILNLRQTTVCWGVPADSMSLNFVARAPGRAFVDPGSPGAPPMPASKHRDAPGGSYGFVDTPSITSTPMNVDNP